MVTKRIHTCIYFDDGDAEHRCACGSRASYLAEDDGTDPVLIVLDDDALPPTRAVGRFYHELAISA